MLKIKETDFDLYFSDKEIKYISLNAFINKSDILAACANYVKPVKEPIKKPIK